VIVYEHHRSRPLSRSRFLRRLAIHFLVACALMLLSLMVGMWGYEHFESLGWRDAFVNAAMLLGGMGPVNRLQTDNGKVFAGCYALYAGLVFLVVAGLLLAPMVHRIMHFMHWEEDASKGAGSRGRT
jgi:hypothetical protein